MNMYDDPLGFRIHEEGGGKTSSSLSQIDGAFNF